MSKLFQIGFLAGGLFAACLCAPAQDLLNMKGTDRPNPLKDVGIDQKLDAQIPLDLPFRDDTGRDVKLGDYFGKKPVVLALVYYSCPMLCTQILNGMVSSLRVVTFNPGDEFEVVAVSFDARERPPLAAEKKQAMLKQYGRLQTAKGWHFLTGDLASVKALTSAVGFRYTFDVHTNQFAHASAIMVLTPEGKLSKYYYGIEYSPKDLRLGLIEAAQNKIGTPADQILLFCYHWDPTTGKYTPIALGGLRLAGVATLLLMGGFFFVNFRREARERAAKNK
jgi:protein SCO1/2